MLKRGDLLSALRETDKALQHYPSEKTEWHWRFTVLKAEILVRQGQNSESMALLSPELPSAYSSTDFAVRRKLTLGLVNAVSQRPREATQFITEAETLAKSNHPELLGEAALRRGSVCFMAGDNTGAEIAYRAALEYARDHKDPFFEAAALSGLAIVSTKLEHYDEAIDLNSAALHLSQSVGARYSQAQVLGNMAWCYRKLGDYENALALYKQAEEAAAQNGVLGDQIYWLTGIENVYYEQHEYAAAQAVLEQALGMARRQDDKGTLTEFLNDLSEIAVETGQVDLAENYQKEASDVEKVNPDQAGVLESLLIRGRIRESRGNYAAAEDCFQRLISDPQTSSSQKWEAHARLAKVYAEKGLDSKAENEFHRSLDTIEGARSSVQTEELRMSFLSTALSFYDDYIEFLIAHQRIQDALQIAELSRARTLAEGLGTRPNALSFSSHNFQPQQIAHRLNAILLFYWIGQKHSYLWLITPAKLSYFPLPRKSEIDPAVKAYRQSILDGQDVLTSGSANGKQLYDMLVAPGRNLIPKNSRVILLPAESLYGLNLETLIVPDPNPHYWIEDVTLSEASSLALLSAASQNAVSSGRNLLLVGNTEPADSGFPALAQAPAEIQKVSQHFQGAQCAVLQGKQATPSAYLHSNPEHFTYLHFVTHGTASHTRPLESALILSREGDSYKLYARDIIVHPLKAQLVTVSACNGAGTRAYAGEGLVGLSWAFLRAGARNVVASLWEVSDASSTAQLMDALYEGLDRREDPATALRHAKLFILKSNSNTVFRKPFYWAPFQLYVGS